MKKFIDFIPASNFLFLPCLLLATLYSLLPTLLFAQSGWSEDQRIVFLPGGGWDPRADCCGDTIHLVWWQRYPVHEEIFYKRSTDAGFTWEDDVLLSIEDTQISVLPQVAVSGDVVHVIWFEDDYGLLYRRSLDGGSIWQDIDSIVPGMTYSSICSTGDTVYIAGTIGSLGVLRFTKSYDNGNSWQPVIEITRASSSPRVRVVANNVLNLIVSYDKGGSPVGVEVYHVLTLDGGDTWLDSVMLSYNDSIHSFNPAMAVDDTGGIHIDWCDYKYSPYPWTGDIFYRVSRDTGYTWEDIDSLTVAHRAVASDILAESGNLHLVWEDDRHDFDENFEIYYRMSTDLGQSWGSEVRLTDTLNWSRRPSLACAGQYLHLFWFDLRDDPSNIIGEIYYKRKDLSQAIGETDMSLSTSKLNFDLYPNPFHDILNIRIELRAKGIGENLDVKLYDVIGKEVVCYEVNEKKDRIIIDTRNLPCGVYFVQIQAGAESGIRKVIKVE